MGSYLQQVFAQLPPGLPAGLGIQEHSSAHMSLLRLRTVFAEPRAFQSFKFLMPLAANHPREHVDRRVHVLRERTLFAVNPGQAHGVVVRGDTQETDGYLVFFVAPAFLRKIARAMYGREDLAFVNQVVVPSAGLRHTVRRFQDEARSQGPGRQLMLDSLSLQIGIDLLREVPHNLAPPTARRPHLDRLSVDRVVDYLHAHYREDLSLEQVARAVHYSPFHLARLFKAQTGRTLFQQLQEIKIDRAKELLRGSGKTVTEICFLSGFNNRSHFTASFKRREGLSPLAYRRVLWGGRPRLSDEAGDDVALATEEAPGRGR